MFLTVRHLDEEYHILFSEQHQSAKVYQPSTNKLRHVAATMKNGAIVLDRVHLKMNEKWNLNNVQPRLIDKCVAPKPTPAPC